MQAVQRASVAESGSGVVAALLMAEGQDTREIGRNREQVRLPR
jgi:hypothetical protein